jgi:N-methylhydantoinase B
LSLLTDRRRHRPAGAEGGEPAAAGANRLDDAELPAKASRAVPAGGLVTVTTPGGGGWGARGT